MALARGGTLRVGGEKTQDGLDELVVGRNCRAFSIPDKSLAQRSNSATTLCLGRGGTLGLDAFQ